MSCQINVTCSVDDVESIRRSLFPTDDFRGSDNWLQQCEISLSPTGDLLAFANGRRLVLLSTKWNSKSQNNDFQVTYSGLIHDIDNIQSVACLPIVSQTKSSHVVPDFTCIVLGFDSGYVRFYTENAELLFEEQLHNEKVNGIKCRSQHNPRPDLVPDLHPEEIYVQYQSCVCVLFGNEIVPILRLHRSELAKVQANATVVERVSPNISGKKWGFQDQASIHDIAVVGVNLHGTFDHLLTASNCGGFETKYRSSAPYSNLVLAAGSRPFLGYHYALEGAAQPVFGDVAKAVATKIKSALPGWLTGGGNAKSPVEKQTFAHQPSDTMGCRFGLCDLQRTALNVVLSADHKLAATADSLGRVLLVDACRGICLRIFKGYREAQCAFVQVPDEKQSKFRPGDRVATFLVIYSPKKGTVEIFSVQQGQKIATFTASKHSRLIYNNYGLFGFTTTSKSRFLCQFDTVLLDNNGLMKEISIPFHFALSEENNSRAKDIHFYKKIKQALRDEDLTEIATTCSELQTTEIKQQALMTLLQDSHLSCEIMLKCAESFEKTESDSESYKTILENVMQVLRLFQFLKTNDGAKETQDDKTIILLFEEEEILENLQTLLKLYKMRKNNNSKKVEFSDSNSVAASQFLSIFDLNNSNTVSINKVDDVAHNISGFMFKNTNCSEFIKEVEKTKVSRHDLFFVAIRHWLNETDVETGVQSDMQHFYNIFKTLILTIDREELICDYGSQSKFWSQVREVLAQSHKSFPALKAAHLFKLISEEVEAAVVEEDNIELLSQERVEWSLLIGKLEDISLLSIILSQTPSTKGNACLPKLEQDVCEISLEYILRSGKGSVSELVSRWLSKSGINPQDVITNERIHSPAPKCEETNDDDDIPDDEIEQDKVDELAQDEVFQKYNLIREHFPYSLESGNILANLSWEYALAWQKNVENLENLDASIKCLNCIPEAHLREGLCFLMWNTHLKLIFESTTRLINKVGKLPKERLCRQDTGLTDRQIVALLEIMTRFLDCYMDAAQKSYGTPKPKPRFEHLWDESDKAQSLTELALNQQPVNYDLLHLHYHLSFTLELLTEFGIKQTKPVQNLFESYMHGLFFADLMTKTQINWEYTDCRIQENRIQFLFKAIAGSMEYIRCESEDRIYTSEHARWMSRIVDLAELWNMDMDELRRFELVRSYLNGYDILGDELFKCVANKQKLGPELLSIAGRRLKMFLTTSPALGENLGCLGTSVTRYIEELSQDWCAPSSLAAIENLANRSLSCMNEKCYEYKIAEMLLDGCQTLRRIHETS